jgi:hypothetical protein
MKENIKNMYKYVMKDCDLDRTIIYVCLLDKEHPCHGCNRDRKKCKQLPKDYFIRIGKDIDMYLFKNKPLKNGK